MSRSFLGLRAALLPLLALMALSVVAMLAYGQARGMTWQFDDYSNLRLLGRVSTREGLIDFIFDATAGPLGRPLSLLTFIANYDDWTGNPWGVSRLTLVLHLINALLVWALMRRLFGEIWNRARRPAWLAAWVAGLWLVMPIHASSVLMPIQRMTHVSAFFTLATLFGYAVMRQEMGRQPRIGGIMLLSAWVAGGTLLAAFSKENGVIAVTLVALIEVFFFSPREEKRSALWSAWLVGAFLAVPAALAYHLVMGWKGIHAHFLYYRGYSMADHLATQWVISWEYLRQIVVPRPALLGPYHDGHPVFNWAMWQPYAAVLGWVLVGALAMALRRDERETFRRFGAMLLFGVLWFFACHQVESTFIPLELYFEHRNYLAAIGVCTVIAVLCNELWEGALSKIVPGAAMAALLAYQLISLQQITSLWGQPTVADEVWLIHNPRSTRALQATANDLIGMGFMPNALRLADEFVDENQSLDVAVQFFPYHCGVDAAPELQARFERLFELVDRIERPAGITTGIRKLGDAMRQEKCDGLSLQDYSQWLTHVLENERIKRVAKVRHHVNYEMALTRLKMDDIDGYAKYSKQAFFDFPSVTVAQSIAATLFQHGRLDDAIAWIDQAIEAAPSGLLRESWSKQLESLRQALEDVRHHLEQ